MSSDCSSCVTPACGEKGNSCRPVRLNVRRELHRFEALSSHGRGRGGRGGRVPRGRDSNESSTAARLRAAARGTATPRADSVCRQSRRSTTSRPWGPPPPPRQPGNHLSGAVSRYAGDAADGSGLTQRWRLSARQVGSHLPAVSCGPAYHHRRRLKRRHLL